MRYGRMKFCKILSELDSEEKVRAWIWLTKFDGKEFTCPKCRNDFRIEWARKRLCYF